MPIILAAGAAPRLGSPHALARFGRRTAIEIALANCRRAGLGRPIVVLGCDAARVRAAVPPTKLRGARVIVNRRWRAGMLSSIRAAMRHVPRTAAFLLYPVDLPLLTPAILRRIARAYAKRKREQVIISPVYSWRAGHPVIFAPELRPELARTRTARDLVERDPRRVKLVPIHSRAIYADFDTPAQLHRLQRAFARHRAR
ncbi:MAG: nucleotidyltransferase family protein [Candidatus Acidiferrales bacterium]